MLIKWVKNDRFDFMVPIRKQKFRKFSKMNKPMKVKAKEKEESANIDRHILSKLTTVARRRKIDVHNLLKFERIPLSLLTLMVACKNTKYVTMAWIEGGHTI